MRVNIVSAAVFLLFCLCLPASGQLTWQSASNLWNNFNNAFYVSAGSGAYYRWQQGGSFDENDRWENAEVIEMATDRYIAEPNSQDNAILTALLNEFDSIYGKDWTSDEYNDDIMWMVLAHSRAYLAIYTATKTVTSSMTSWAVNASNNFCWVYNGGHSPGRVNSQYDNTFGGGMWWTNNSIPSLSPKNSCINGPAALAAFYLNVIYPNAGFKAMGTNMINWENNTLVNQTTGEVYDHYDAGGIEGGDLSYNAGTYVGAAGLLGVGIPETAAEFYTNYVCSHDIMNNYHQSPGGQNNDGFNGIFLRWVGTYEILSGNTSWYSFFNNQANAAWAVTNASGLSWDDWFSNTPASGLYSWDCSPSVVALQWAQISQNPTAAPLAPLETLTVAITNGELYLTWPYGTLQAASSPSGPFSNISTTSPYMQPTGPPRIQRYFRVLEN